MTDEKKPSDVKPADAKAGDTKPSSEAKPKARDARPKASDPVVTSTKRPPDPNRPAPEPVVTSTKRVDAKLEPAPAKRTEPKPEHAKDTKEKEKLSRAPEPVVASTSTQKPRAAFVEPTLAAVDALDCEALAIAICSDVRPLAGLAGYVDWRMCGRLSELLRKGVITGAPREKVLVPTLGRIGNAVNGPKRIFLFGWGPQKSILDGATERLAWMVDVLHTAKIERVAVALPEPSLVLLGLVEDHIRRPLGDKCALVFGPDQLLGDNATKETRPIPTPPT